MAKPSKFPGQDTITVDGVERPVERTGFIQSIRELIASKPNTGNATGTGGAKRRRKIDDAVDAMQKGVDDADKDAKR
jgi:hypothetical protein